MTRQQFDRIAAAAADLHALAQDNPELEKALCELGSALADVLCPPGNTSAWPD